MNKLKVFLTISLLSLAGFFACRTFKGVPTRTPQSTISSLNDFTGKYSFTDQGVGYTAWFVEDKNIHAIYSFISNDNFIESHLFQMQDISQDPAKYMKKLCENSNTEVGRSKNLHKGLEFKS